MSHCEYRDKVAQLHDDVIRAIHFGTCSQHPARGEIKQWRPVKYWNVDNKYNKKPFRVVLIKEDVPGKSEKWGAQKGGWSAEEEVCPALEYNY